MAELRFPDALKELPVARSIRNGEIKLEGPLTLVASTGSGKTMVIPAFIANSGKKVLLRQPTRQTAKLTYLGLTKFWGDQLKIGMHSSEEDIGTLDDNDITVCTDGVLKNWLKNPKYNYCVIFDEIHWCQAITEIEVSLVKTYLNEGKKFSIVLLSATIRPSNIIQYFENLNPHPVSESYIQHVCDVMDQKGSAVNTIEQKQWIKCYYSEGVAFPIEDRICNYIEETGSEEGTVMKFARRMYAEKKRGLVFLCTRAGVQNACQHIQEHIPELPVEFAHADIKIENILDFVQENEPCILFATVSLATSATLPFDEVLIIDKGIDSVYENGIEKQVTDIPIDANGVIQRRGRCGRVKPGVCTLASNYRENWDDIKPEALTPPLEKVAPIQAALVCAQYEIDPRHLDTLSKLDKYAISRSVERLRSLGIVYEEEDTLKLTGIGKKIAALPLEVELAAMVAQCPPETLPAVIAIASCDPGLFNIFQGDIIIPETKTKIKGYTLMDPDLVHPQSILITKAKILQGAFKARASEDQTLEQWANMNGMWPKKLEKILFKFYQICKGLNRAESKLREQLMEMDIDSKADEIIEYLSTLRIFEMCTFEYSEYKGRSGFKGEHFGYFCILDGTEAEIMKLNQGRLEIWVMGTTKIIKAKSTSNEICIMSDITVLHNEIM